MNPQPVADALEQAARALMDAAVALRGGGPIPDTKLKRPQVTDRRCTCGQPLERKETKNGKPVDRCPAWRWNDGNPTPDHVSEVVR